MNIRCSRAALLLLSASVFVLLAQPAAAQLGNTRLGAVAGYVFDDTGKVVVGATVFLAQSLPSSAARTAAPPVITGPQVATGVTDAKGRFLASVPAGNYIACATPAAAGLLNPCHWAASAPAFSATAGQITVAPNIVLTHGAVIPIHVNDPQQLMTPATGPVAMDCRFQIVTAKGYRYDAAITAHSATSRDYEITVPYGTAFSLQVIAPHLVVSGSAGEPVAAAGESVLAPAGTSLQTLNHTVTGVKP